MTLRTRRWFFYGLLALFIVLGAGIILYAQGLRINFTTMQTETAGGIFIRSYPDTAQIMLNGKPVQNKSAFLSRGTFISSLAAGRYNVQLSEAGYIAWSENISVQPSVVSELKYAVLVPQNGTAIATSGNIESFFEAGGNTVAGDASGTLSWRGQTIAHGVIISHSTDFKDIIVLSPLGNYLLYDFADATTTNLSALLVATGVKTKNIIFLAIDPYDSTHVVVATAARILEIDLTRDAIVPVETADMGDTIGNVVGISPSLITWTRFDAASNTSQVIIYDKFAGNITDSSLTIPGTVRQLSWVQGDLLGILGDNGSLYTYNVPSETLNKLADDVTLFYPSADGTLIAALEEHSVEIFSLTTNDYYRFNLPQMDAVRSLAWHKDDDHLFVSYPDHISFLDLMDSSLQNFITVSQGSLGSYDPQTNSLYLVDQNKNLVRFDFAK